MAAAGVSKMHRTRGYSRSEGFEYEYKLAGIVDLRARRLGLKCETFMNGQEARPCDDVIVCVQQPRQARLLLQLKHKEASKVLTSQAFTTTGDFSIKEYYKYFKKYQQKHLEVHTLKDDTREFYSCPIEDVRIVLFTTRKPQLDYTNQNKLGRGAVWKELDFSLDNLLNTGEKDHVFSFGSSDKEIWELMDDEDEDDINFYRNTFLPRLRIFSGQMMADSLDSVLSEALPLAFGDQKLPLEYVSTLTLRFLDALKLWAKDRKRADSIGDAKGPLAVALAASLRPTEEVTRAACKDIDIKFEKAAFESLSKKIPKKSDSRLTEQENYSSKGQPLQKVLLLEEKDAISPLHRLRLFQFLRRDFPDDWVHVTQKILLGFPFSALEATCGVCSVLVLDHLKAHQLLSVNLCRLVKVAAANGTILVFLASRDDADTRGVYIELADTSFKKWQKSILNLEWTFSNFTAETKDIILDQNITFQGNAMALRTLLVAWPKMRDEANGTLWADVVVNRVVIGAPFNSETKGEFPVLERKLVHRILLKKGTHLALERQGCTLVLGRCPADLPEGNWTIGSKEGEYVPSSIEEATFTRVCEENKDKSVLWLQWRIDGHLELRGFHNASISGEFIEPLCSSCIPTTLQNLGRARWIMVNHSLPMCEHNLAAEDVANWDAKVALLVDYPGTGKSHLLCSAAAKAQNRTPGRWIVFMRTLELLTQLKQLQNSEGGKKKIIPLHDLGELLAVAAAVDSNVGRQCLQSALQESGAIDIYVDGVDEICPEFKDISMRILESLMKTKVRRLWVSSRPEVEDSLSARLKCTPVRLVPLSQQDQISFMCKCWASTLSCNAERFRWIAEDVITAVKTNNVRQEDPGLLFSPLHVWMVVKVCAKEVELSLKPGYVLSPRALMVTRLDLYRRFVKEMQDEYKRRYNLNGVENLPYKDNFEAVHQHCAILKLISWRLIDLDEEPIKKYIDENKSCLEKEKRGIVWLKNDTIHFIHFTFIEYFAASWIFRNLPRSTIKYILKQIYEISNHSLNILTDFMEAMLAEESPLHEAVYYGDKEGVDAALRISDNTKATDSIGRTALHTAVQFGRTEIVRTLLNNGFEAKERFIFRRPSALSIADVTPLDNNGLECAELLLQKGANKGDLKRNYEAVKKNPLALQIPVGKGLVEVCRCMLGVLEKDILTPILTHLIVVAVINKRPAVLRLLFEHRPKRDANWNPLIFFPGFQSSILHISAQSGPGETVKLLLEHGKHTQRYINKGNASGETPLHVAAQAGDPIVVALLLHHGANMKLRNKLKDMPIHNAAAMGHARVAVLLAKRGSPIMCLNKLGKTPAQLARDAGHTNLARGLEEVGAIASGAASIEKPRKRSVRTKKNKK